MSARSTKISSSLLLAQVPGELFSLCHVFLLKTSTTTGFLGACPWGSALPWLMLRYIPLALPSSQRDRRGEVEGNVTIPNHDFKLGVSRSCFGTFSPQRKQMDLLQTTTNLYPFNCPSTHPSTHSFFYILSTERVGPHLWIVFSTSYIFFTWKMS